MAVTLGYFADTFEVSETDLDEHGAFNISLISDLPLFIDPFLLFQSDKSEYVDLHDGIVRYLNLLVDKVGTGTVTEDQIKEWFLFKEVYNNWLGFSFLSNKGRGLGKDFAKALIANLQKGLDAGGRGTHL